MGEISPGSPFRDNPFADMIEAVDRCMRAVLESGVFNEHVWNQIRGQHKIMNRWFIAAACAVAISIFTQYWIATVSNTRLEYVELGERETARVVLELRDEVRGVRKEVRQSRRDLGRTGAQLERTCSCTIDYGELK